MTAASVNTRVSAWGARLVMQKQSDGHVEISDVSDLYTAVRRHESGDEVKVEFIRDGIARTVEVTVGNRESE